MKIVILITADDDLAEGHRFYERLEREIIFSGRCSRK